MINERPTIIEFGKELYRIWITERPSQLAASLAYYGMFAFAPVIFVAFWVAGIFIDELATAEQFYTRLGNLFGPEVVEMIQESVEAIASSATGSTVLATLVSVVALLMVASGLFFQLQYALNTIWGVPPPKRGQTAGFIRQRLFSFLMVIGVGLILILATLVNVVLSWFGSLFDLNSSLPVLNVLGFLGIATLAFALIYKILPETEIAWRDVLIGAVVTAIMMAIGLLIFGAYLSRGKIGSAFEAAGAFAVLMIGIYTIAQIFLFGAMFTRVFASMYGSKARREAPD